MIWIYTVCKGRVYLGSAGQGLRRSLGDNISYFFIKIYIVGTHQKRLSKVLLMSTHNICFYGEMEKIIPEI